MQARTWIRDRSKGLLGRPAQLQQPAATVLTEWDGLKLEGIKLDRGRPLHSGANSDEYYNFISRGAGMPSPQRLKS